MVTDTAQAFTVAATLTGDTTIDGDTMRIWLGQSMGTISSGEYADTSIITTGTSIALYVKRDGVSVGTVRLDLSPIVAAALDALESAANGTPR